MFDSRHVELGLDLGSANTRVVARGRGVVVDVPSFVAIQATHAGREPAAYGDEAKRMLGRTAGNTKVVRPVRGGAIDDYEASEHLLAHVLAGVSPRRPWKPRLVVAVPSEATEVERRALQESARAGGVGEVLLVKSSVAAVVGAQLPFSEPIGSMVVSVGGGRTEVAVHSLGGQVLVRSLRVAGDAMDEQITTWLRRTHHMMVGAPTAERVKIEVGAASATPTAYREGQLRQTRVRGRDLSTGAPKTVDLRAEHIATAIADTVDRIRDLVIEALAATPPELCADIHAHGIVLTGGGALLEGLDGVLRDATGLPVVRSDAPAHCVARGLSALLENPALLKRVLDA